MAQLDAIQKEINTLENKKYRLLFKKYGRFLTLINRTGIYITYPEWNVVPAGTGPAGSLLNAETIQIFKEMIKLKLVRSSNSKWSSPNYLILDSEGYNTIKNNPPMALTNVHLVNMIKGNIPPFHRESWEKRFGKEKTCR